MAQVLMDLSPEGTAPPPDMSPADSMLNYLPKNGASFVFFYHNGNTKEICGQRGKAAQTEGNPIDDKVHLTSLPMVTTAESAPTHKSVPLAVSETADFKEYAQIGGMILGQGKIRTFSLLVVGFGQMVEISFKPFKMLLASMGCMRETTNADRCWHFL